MHRSSVHSRGFTLIEASVVVAVLAIVAASAVPSLAKMIDARRLAGAARQLAADVQTARTEAIARNRSLPLTIQGSSAGSCYVVHTGAAGRCTCADGAPVCSGGEQALRSAAFAADSRLVVNANVGSLLFDPQHGTVSPTGTLRVADVHGRAVQHVVNIVGRVRSCASGLAGSGYPAC